MALEADGHEITTDAPVDDAESGSWRRIDKAAGVGALVLMSGYQVSAIESPVVGAMDAVLGPAAAVVPFPLLVLSVALGTATISTVVRRQLVDRDALESQKDRMKRVRAKLKQARERGDAAAVERFEAEQRDVTQAQLGMLTRSLRPMVWTMLVTVPVFLWLSWLVVSPSTAIAHAAPFIPVIDRIAWTARVLGPMRLWMVWYVACQLASTLVVRRSLDRLESRRSVRI